MNGYDWPLYTTASTSSSTTLTFTPSMTSYWPAAEPAPPRGPSLLEWLDREIEKTCAIARSAA